MTQNLKQQAATVAAGARTWRFWLRNILFAAVGGFANSGLTFLNNISSQGVGIDTGDAISFAAFMVNSSLGALTGVLYVLKTFKPTL